MYLKYSKAAESNESFPSLFLIGYSFGSGLVATKAFISMKMQVNSIRIGTATQNARVE